MTNQIDRPIIPQWLENYLNTLEKPDVPTYELLAQVGQDALRAKIEDVEMFNMNVASRLRKRLPDKLDFDEVAAIMLHLFTFRLIRTSKDPQDTLLGLYVPSNTDIWKKSSVLSDAKGIYTTDTKFYHYLISLIAPKFKPKDIDDVISRISDYAPHVETTKDSHLYPVNNGVYNQKTKELEEFTPDYVYLTKIGVDYKPNIQNPKIQEPDGSYWDVESWLESLSATPEINELLWQVISASLQPNRGFNKSIWFYSESGNNGKGTVGQLIKNLLGVGNYASLSVADFKHEFLKQSLIGVAANISDENDVDEFIDSVKDYKASVTGDDLIINRKHKDPIRLQFRGLNIQMMNGLPKTKDKTGSFYRRLIIVPFIKSFTDNGEKGYIKSDFIHRKEVLEYTLFKALNLEFEEFIVPQASVHLLEQYKEKNNPVLDFWRELREEFVWDLVPKQFLYDLYQKWFERSNPSGTIIGQRTFFDQLSPIIDADSEWDNHLGSDKSNVRSDGKMDKDEPLITEYGLDKPYKNGAPSPWAHPTYKGTDIQKKRDFVRKTKYRGIVRR